MSPKDAAKPVAICSAGSPAPTPCAAASAKWSPWMVTSTSAPFHPPAGERERQVIAARIDRRRGVAGGVGPDERKPVHFELHRQLLPEQPERRRDARACERRKVRAEVADRARARRDRQRVRRRAQID